MENIFSCQCNEMEATKQSRDKWKAEQKLCDWPSLAINEITLCDLQPIGSEYMK